IQPGDPDRTPFFMLSGDLTGGGFYCRRLASTLGPSQPVYVIPPVAPTDDEGLATIEGMAAGHLRDIRGAQPRGPYRLGGFCAGGLIAYEMARQLRAQGETVELLLLVDTSPPKPISALMDAMYGAVSRLASRDPLNRLEWLAWLRRLAVTRGEKS